MSNQMSPDQVRLAVQREKQAGFIVHCKDVLGMSPRQVQSAHASYQAQDASREARLNGLRGALLGN